MKRYNGKILELAQEITETIHEPKITEKEYIDIQVKYWYGRIKAIMCLTKQEKTRDE